MGDFLLENNYLKYSSEIKLTLQNSPQSEYNKKLSRIFKELLFVVYLENIEEEVSRQIFFPLVPLFEASGTKLACLKEFIFCMIIKRKRTASKLIN